MAFLGYSDVFDLDDDGILRDSASSGGILIDDDGIVRDDFDNQSKYTSRSSTTHWTDSGLGGDKQSAAGSTSTLRQFDLQSYPSLDDFSHPLNDSHTNISDLEASKDDLTFEGDFRDSFDRDFGYDNESQSPTPRQHHGKSLLDSRNSSLTFDDTEGSALRSTTESNQKELFDTDYYKQLQELGVLVDGSELPEPEFIHTQTSLNEFEQLEDHLSRDDIEFEPDIPEEPHEDPIQEFLRRTPTRNLESPAFDRGTPTRNLQSPALERQRGTPTRNLHSPLFNKERGTPSRNLQSPALERGYGIRDQHSPYGDREFRKRQGSDVSLTEDQPHHIRPVSAGSARTISSRSFPEISPEEALQYYKDSVNYHDDLNLVDNDAASLDFESSQRTCDDDEIFIITSRISDAPKPAKLRAYEVYDRDTPMTVSSYSSRSASRTSQASNHGNERKGSVTKGGNYMHDQSFASSLGDRSFDQDVSLPDTRGYTSHNQEGSVTLTGPNNSHPLRHTGSRTPTNTRVSPRPESAASQRSSASEHNSSRSKVRSDQQREEDQSVLKARSQESFFEQKSPKPSDRTDKMPKRLLPKPSATEVNQSFRVKSKSTSNISTKPGPVKPKHNSVSDLSHERIYETEHDSNDPQSEGVSVTSDKSKTELSSKLNQEFHKRKQATELVQQLQKDYDKLLSKYAMAELTIDQLRLGAHITLHTASPTPSQATSGSIQSVQQPQILHLQRGVKSPSPFQGSMGYASPLLNDSTVADGHNERGQGARNKLGSQSEAVLPNGHTQQNAAETKEMGLSMENGAESVKIGLMFQARSLDERMESFKTLLDEDQLTHDEQEKVFEKLRTDHEKLRRDYLQSKEDYNVLKRTNANVGGDVNFDEEKELEGELFKLGMKFDEIHEKVDEEMQKKSSQRQPFQGGGRLTSDTDGSAAGSDLEGKSVDHMKRKMNSVKAGDDLLRPQDDSEFGKKLTKLHVDYNSLMDRYRRLKQMAQTPERDKEIDNLVRKLNKICNQEPDIFKMPQELQTSQPLYMSSMASDVSQTGSDLDDEMPRYEQLQEQDDAMKRRRSSASSQRPMASVQNQSFTREGSPGFNTSNSFHQRSHSEQNGVDSQRGQYRNTPRDSRDSQLHDDSFRSSFSSRGNTPRGSIDRSFDRDSPNPNLPRPRRHDHPDRKSGMKKRPESGSFSSLQDSGISEHDEAIGGAVGGNLSNLPGPGKFKQMTKQRNAHDADSGFIGSMVGSEVSQLSSRQQQQQQQQPSLRLRQPSPQDERLRSRLREAVETASVGSSRSGRPRQDERPPSRGSLRSGSRRSSRDSANMTRDYTDDSYTLTESEMSFDSQQSKSRREQTRQKARDLVSKAIQEEEEGRSQARPRQTMSRESPRPTVLQQTQEPVRTPAKTKRSKVNVSFSEEDVTPKPTPNHSFNDTRDLLSSDEETPRQIQNRLAPKPEMPKTPAVTRQQRPPTPKGAGELARPLTPGVKEDVFVRRSSLRSQGSDRSRRQEEIRPKMVDRSIGSESDDVSEAPTVATRGSQGSERFSLLKEEIGKLREEFHKANEQQRQQLLEQQRQQQLQQTQLQAPPQAPPPSQPTNQQQDDYYFDPTEDPYAFMRGPRRRANSFSGAPTREWDDWWRMPLQSQNTGEDLPLGYAAADSYATPRLRNNLEASQGADVRARPQQRVRRRYRRGQNTETQPVAGYESDQSPTRPTAATSTDEQLYNYYVPRYKRQQLANQQPATGAPVATNDYSSPQPTQHRPNHYASQPNLVYTSYPAANAPVASSVYATTPQQPKPQPRQYMPASSYSTPISAGYSNRRQWTHPQYRIPTSTTQRPYSYDDLDVQGQNPQPVAYVLADELPTAVQGHPSTEPIYGMPTSVSTEACPLCGGVGVHTHTEHEVPPQTTPTVLYALQTPPPTVRSRPRRRSKSASRVRHYSPEGHARSKYIVREYGDNSSAESDDEMYRRRSRSAGRHRRRPGRRYRKVKTRFHSNSNQGDGGGVPVVGGDSQTNTANSEPQSDDDEGEYEDSLNESLNLTEEIDDLTHKMIKTVKGELAKSKKKKGFGSSVW